VTLHGIPPSLERLARPLGIAFIVIVSGVLLFMALGPHVIGDYLAETDFYGAYAEGSRMIQQGKLDPARYTVVGPIYDLTLAVASSIIPDRFTAAELISVVSSVGTLLLWFLLISRRIGGAAALWTVLLLGANATFLRYGYSASTDALAIALQASALFGLLAVRGNRAPLHAGALTGLACLTRYNSVYLIPSALIFYLWFDDSGRSRKEATLQYCAAAFVLLIPWWLLTASSGHLPGGELYHNVAYDAFARGRGLTWDQYQKELQPQFHSLWDVIRYDPGTIVLRLGHNVIHHLQQDFRELLGWSAAVAFCVGLALVLVGRERKRLLPVLVSAGVLFLTLVPAQHGTRYSLALAPMYLCFAGAAIGLPRYTVNLRGIPLKWLIGLALVMSSGIASYKEHRYLMTQLPFEVLPAGKALREVAHPGARLMARKPHIGYYSGLELVPFANANSFAELASYCREHGVNYIYFSWPEADLRPQFAYLLDTSATVPGLTVVKEVRKHPAVVYRIDKGFGFAPGWLANDEVRKLHEARAEVLIHEDEAWQAHMTLAVAAGRAGNYEEAISHLEAVIRWRPNHLRAHLLLGEAHLKLKRYDEAQSHFGEILKRDPRNVDAHLGLGWVKVYRGQFQAAAEAWRPVVSETKHVPTLQEMKRLFSRTGDVAAAEAASAALKSLGAQENPSGPDSGR